MTYFKNLGNLNAHAHYVKGRMRDVKIRNGVGIGLLIMPGCPPVRFICVVYISLADIVND